MKNFKRQFHASKKTFLYAVIALFGVVILMSAVVRRDAIAQQMHEWKVLPNPERITELYFNNSQNLPTAYTPDVSQPISFTIHNLEYQQVNYKITVTATSGEKKILLKTESVELQNDQSSNQSLDVNIPNLGERVKVTFTLRNQNQSIHYWVVKKS